VLHALARLRIFLVGSTNDRRESYSTIWNQTLWEGCYIEKRNPEACTLIDVSTACRGVFAASPGRADRLRFSQLTAPGLRGTVCRKLLSNPDKPELREPNGRTGERTRRVPMFSATGGTLATFPPSPITLPDARWLLILSRTLRFLWQRRPAAAIIGAGVFRSVDRQTDGKGP